MQPDHLGLKTRATRGPFSTQGESMNDLYPIPVFPANSGDTVTVPTGLLVALCHQLRSDADLEKVTAAHLYAALSVQLTAHLVLQGVFKRDDQNHAEWMAARALWSGLPWLHILGQEDPNQQAADAADRLLKAFFAQRLGSNYVVLTQWQRCDRSLECQVREHYQGRTTTWGFSVGFHGQPGQATSCSAYGDNVAMLHQELLHA